MNGRSTWASRMRHGLLFAWSSVTSVRRQRVAAALLDDRSEPSFDLCERLVPTHGASSPPSADRGFANSVRILVQLLEGRPLRADEAPAEDVIEVAPDPFDDTLDDRDLEAASCLTERAGAIGDVRHRSARVAMGPPAVGRTSTRRRRQGAAVRSARRPVGSRGPPVGPASPVALHGEHDHGRNNQPGHSLYPDTGERSGTNQHPPERRPQHPPERMSAWASPTRSAGASDHATI